MGNRRYCIHVSHITIGAEQQHIPATPADGKHTTVSSAIGESVSAVWVRASSVSDDPNRLGFVQREGVAGVLQ